MSVLTINAFPSNSYVTVVYNSETTVGMVPFTMEIETGSTIQYKVEALQCTPDPDPSKGSEYKTLLIDEDKTLSVILNYIGAVQPDTWVPALGNETFPTHIAMLGKGGWRSVESKDERDAIPSARREAGMSVYVSSEKKLYILNSDLVTWSLFSAGGVVVMPTPSETELGNIVQYIGETTEDYTQGYFYKCISDGADPATYSWKQVDVQPATDLVWGNITGTLSDQTDLQGALDSKLTTTDEASKVYGTNDQGEQVRYDVNDFGQIDNVAIHGVDQTITDKRVDLKVVEQENSLPTASEDLVGRIVQYTGTTNENYTHGYFYECKVSGAPSEAICTATDSGTLYPYHITIDKDTFETQITTGGEYVFQYNGTNWTLSGTAVDLADYGISIQEGITYSSGDNMYIQYTESTIGYSWSPVSVQTSTVFRRIVEE